MNNIGQNKRGLRLARLYKHRGLISVHFSKFMSICLKMAFMRLQNHLVCYMALILSLIKAVTLPNYSWELENKLTIKIVSQSIDLMAVN